MDKSNRMCDQLPSSVTLLVVGKIGAGKSVLVNSLIGKKVAREGAATDIVEKYTATIRCVDAAKDVHVTVWDSPGYEDDDEEEGGQDAYFEELKSVDSASVDLLLFCIPLNDRRWRKDDEAAMTVINRAFGPSIWNKAMVALTQANLIQDSNGQVTKKAYEEKLKQWTHKIDAVLESLGVQNEVLAVPTGNFVDMSLPDTDDWFSEFWTKAFRSMSADKRGFWQTNESRIQFSSGQDRASRTEVPINNQSDRPNNEVEKGSWEAFMHFLSFVMPLISLAGFSVVFYRIGCSVVSFFRKML